MSFSDDTGTVVVTKKKLRTKTPRLYKVLLLNDDFTSMDFVVRILESIFKKNPAEAVQIMMQIHRGGSGLCGIYSKQIGESKVMLVHERAQSAGFPLRSVMEEV